MRTIGMRTIGMRTIGTAGTVLALWLVLGLALAGCEGDGGGGPDAPAGDVSEPGDANRPADTDGPGDTDRTDDGGGDTNAPTGGPCDDDPAPVPPVGTDDADYDTVVDHACASRVGDPDLCLCDAAMAPFLRSLLACEPVGGGGFWSQGSVYARAVGRRDGACRMEIGLEMEGGVQLWECALPLPIVPWSGLRTSGDTSMGAPSFLTGIEADCAPAGSCCLLEGCPGFCPATAPVCPWDLAAPGLRCDL
jgi:hypothetical protein